MSDMPWVIWVFIGFWALGLIALWLIATYIRRITVDPVSRKKAVWAMVDTLNEILIVSEKIEERLTEIRDAN